jgi:hypothetical protein
VAGALLLRFLGTGTVLLVLVLSTFWASAGWVVVVDGTVMVGSIRNMVIAVLYSVASAGCGSCIVGEWKE